MLQGQRAVPRLVQGTTQQGGKNFVKSSSIMAMAELSDFQCRFARTSYVVAANQTTDFAAWAITKFCPESMSADLGHRAMLSLRVIDGLRL